MAHLTARSAYEALSERLNRFPQGAPPSELLYRILAMLFSEHEAALVAGLPIRPFTAERAATVWKMPEAEARVTLDRLAQRALLLDVDEDGVTRYFLPPPMAGFFEFSLMRVRTDIDQKLLAELFYQYLNVEEDFVRRLFTDGETQLGRVFVDETALPIDDGAITVLDWERASEVVATATAIGVGRCYCRHKMEHVGRACDAPQDICMTFNSAADSLTRHGVARRVEPVECLDLLAAARERSLVQFGENVRESVSFVCNCCGCCCEALIAARRFAHLRPVHTTNFVPAVTVGGCTGCGRCVTACPVEAMALVSANDPGRPRRCIVRVDEDLCLGCGICVRACRTGAIVLRARGERVITPLNSAHRTVLMAIERGTLAHLIVDSQATFGHRAVTALLGAVFALPPLKQVLASQQLRSRYLEAVLARVH